MTGRTPFRIFVAIIGFLSSVGIAWSAPANIDIVVLYTTAASTNPLIIPGDYANIDAYIQDRINDTISGLDNANLKNFVKLNVVAVLQANYNDRPSTLLATGASN